VEETYEAVRPAGAVSGNYAGRRFFDCLRGVSQEPLGNNTPDRRDEETTFHHSAQNDVGM
jgi:hypothetical protein